MDDLTTKELAIHHFQDKLSKFCPADKNRPNGFEIAMFEAGYAYCGIKLTKAEEKIEELQAENARLRKAVSGFEKDEKMFLAEHDENVRLHFENVDLKEQNQRFREALEWIATDFEAMSLYADVQTLRIKARAALEGKK